MKGTVAWFNAAKSYGFITPKNGGEDVFVHYTAILMDGYKRLSQGDVVEFEMAPADGKKRPMAANVRVLEVGNGG